MGSSISDKLSLGEPIPVKYPGYYRLVDGELKMTSQRINLGDKDYFVGKRDWQEYYRKRIEATGKDTFEDTFSKGLVLEKKNPSDIEISKTEEIVDNSSSDTPIR